MAIYYLGLPDRDFLFEPIKDSTLLLYAGILGKDTKGILVKNESNHPIQVRRNMKLSDLLELTIDGCYHITTG